VVEPADRLSSALRDRYRTKRQLGEGGMATVYLAEDVRHRRMVALKVLKPELAAFVGGERFLAEIETRGSHRSTPPPDLPLYRRIGSFLLAVSNQLRRSQGQKM
jgi:serine/threonine protein kinase